MGTDRVITAAQRACRVAWAVLGVWLALPLAGQAQQPSEVISASPSPPPASATSGELTRAQAIALVQRRYHARVVRTVLAEQEGRRVYVFKLLSAGSQVWTVRIDAKTGAQVQP